MSARDAALRIMLRLEERREPVQAALDGELGRAALEPRDAALCTELVYGFLRMESRLEYVLGTLLAKPDKLPREMLLALGLAAYGLLFLRRVPSYATVDWAVSHVRRRFGIALSRVANGALRALIRLEQAPLEEDFYHAPGRSDLERLALFCATPLWIARLWADAYGAERAGLLLRRASRQPRPCLRLNVRHSACEALLEWCRAAGGEAVAHSGMVFAPGTAPRHLGGNSIEFWQAEGALSWQSAGSQEALRVLGPWQAPVWDVCAGQGGKSLALAEQGVAVGLCGDMHAGRLKHLRRTAARLGLPCPPLVLANAERPPLRRWMGDILLDAPCSGLGTLARRPEIRRRRTPEDVRELAVLQARMLARAWEVCPKGGHVAYITCTLTPQENEAQVRMFLRGHADAHPLVEWRTPDEHPWMEGMYAVRLQKRR